MPPTVIEAIDNTGNVMVQRMPQQGSGDWQLGSQVIVQENQVAVFWRDGQALDGFRPGRHTIETANVPMLGKAVGAGFGGQSPFRACVYFLSTKVFQGVGWGTPQPVTFRDGDFGMVPVRAFGMFSYRLTKPRRFMSTIVGTQGLVATDDIHTTLRSYIVSRLNRILGESLKCIADLPVMYDDIALRLKDAVREEFEQYGIGLVDLVVEAITPPQEVQDMISKAAGIAVQDVDRYQKIAAADAMVEGAKNPAGGAAAGIGAGLGAGLGMAMGQQVPVPAQPPQPAEPPQAPTKEEAAPAPGRASLAETRERLQDAKQMLDDGLIDESDFKEIKARILKEF